MQSFWGRNCRKRRGLQPNWTNRQMMLWLGPKSSVLSRVRNEQQVIGPTWAHKPTLSVFLDLYVTFMPKGERSRIESAPFQERSAIHNCEKDVAFEATWGYRDSERHSWAKIGSPLRISLAIEVTPIDALAQRLGGLPDLQILRSCLLCANFANKAIIILVLLAPCSNHINHILVICVAVPTFALNWVSRSISQG
jgi:hypothetical protein